MDQATSASANRRLSGLFRVALLVALPGFAIAFGGCVVGPRLRLIRSTATQASWIFTLEDRGRDAELFIDGRLRFQGCYRAGRQVYCELLGVYPGGHTIELRLPAAVLRRSALVGRPWSTRPMWLRVHSADDVEEAARAGLDGVVIEALDAQPVVQAAHLRGLRAILAGPRAAEIETTGADGLLGWSIPSEVRGRFPEARTFVVDQTANAALGAYLDPSQQTDLARVAGATGLVEAKGPVAAAIALVAPKGVIIDRAALPLYTLRRTHPLLRALPELVRQENHRALFTFGRDITAPLLFVNAEISPWSPAELDRTGADLLLPAADAGVSPGGIRVRAPQPPADPTRY